MTPDPSDPLSFDPFPSIPPSLLSAADIEDYALAIPLLKPFEPERLKTASYSIGVGKVFATVRESPDGELAWSFHSLGASDSIVLKPNSVVYVSLDTRVQLPLYLAARFNLRIRHVYRGLLAGTGPLVDPGFKGELYIPLHNLSSEEYRLWPGERLIWMEFTKLAPRVEWELPGWAEPARTAPVREFDTTKSQRELVQYLNDATDGRPIRSSVDYVLAEARDSVAQAEASADASRAAAEGIRRTFTIVAVLTVLALLVTLASLVIQLNGVIRDVNEELRLIRGTTPTAVTTTLPPALTTAPNGGG